MTTTIADSATGTEERPRLRPDIVFGPPLHERDTVVYHVKDRATGWYYRLGPREHFILSMMDGNHTTPQIADEYLATFGRRLGPDHWTQIFTLLHRRRLMASVDRVDDDLADLMRLRDDAVQNEKRSRRTLLLYRFPLVRPDRLLARLSRRTSWLYSPFFVVPASLAAVSVQVVTVFHFTAIRAQVSGSRGDAVFIVATVGAFWLLAFVHECAHGLTCRRYGANVPEIGIMWRFPLLVPYCRTDDVMLLQAPRHRVYTAFAGVFSTLVASLPLAGLCSPRAAQRAQSRARCCCTAASARWRTLCRSSGWTSG